MISLVEYCQKHKIKLREVRGGVEVRYSMKNNGAHIDEFTKRLIRPLRGIAKITDWEYVTSPNTFSYRDWPKVKVKATFKGELQ